MKSQIKGLARQTMVYGAGNVLTRLVTFLLLPLFTHVLTPGEYGITTLVYVFLGFMNIIYHYGLDAAFMRHVSDVTDESDRRRLFSTAIWLSLGTSGALSLLVAGLAGPLSQALLGSTHYSHLFILSAGILILDALGHVPFAFLRVMEKAGLFIFIKTLNVVTTFSLNIYLVAYLKKGITGIFISALAASLITTLAVFVVTMTFLRPKFSLPLARDYLAFGLPFVPAGLSSIAMEMIDRYILLVLKDTATVGIYSAGYKLGIFMLLLTTAFNYAWQPFFLKIGKGTDARLLFARIFTYFTLTTLLVWVILTGFIHELIRFRIAGYSIIGPTFYGAEPVVPIVLLAYVFQGVYLNFLPGIYFEKKTKVIPLITGAGALINIGLNFLLIPSYGITGAAVATTGAYFSMAVLTFFVTRRFFSVPYEWQKIVRISLSAAVAISVIYLFNGSILVKLVGISLYIVGVFTMRILSPEERKQLGLLFRRGTGGT